MPDWVRDLFGGMDAVQMIAWLVAFGFLIAFLVKAWPWLRNFVRMVDALADLPDFMVRTEDTLRLQAGQVADIHHEVHYNDETSVKDAVARVELGVRGLYERAENAAVAAEKVRTDLEETNKE